MFGLSLGRMGNLGWRGKFASSSLNLNFVSSSQVLDPRITFTRASAGTRFNSAGTLVSMSNNEPRFDYDPVTLQPKGLLLEEQRTNLVLQSETFGSPWSITSGFVSASGGLLIEGASGDAQCSFAQAINVTSGSTFCGYIDIEYVDNRYVQLVLGAAVFGTVAYANFDLLLGVPGSKGSGCNASIQAIGVGKYRIIITSVASGTASTNFQINHVPDATSARAPNIAMSGKQTKLLRSQFEAGAFPTSYIPTTTAAATRAADVAVMTGANFSSWYRQDEGTLFVEVGSVGNANALRAVTLSDGTLNNQAWIRSAAPPTNAAEVYTAGAFVAQMGVNTGGAAKTALAVKANDFAVSVNGGAAATDTSGALGVYSQMNLGANFNSSSTFLNGHIRRIGFFPRRLSNAELQALTS